MNVSHEMYVCVKLPAFLDAIIIISNYPESHVLHTVDVVAIDWLRLTLSIWKDMLFSLSLSWDS